MAAAVQSPTLPHRHTAMRAAAKRSAASAPAFHPGAHRLSAAWRAWGYGLGLSMSETARVAAAPQVALTAHDPAVVHDVGVMAHNMELALREKNYALLEDILRVLLKNDIRDVTPYLWACAVPGVARRAAFLPASQPNADVVRKLATGLVLELDRLKEQFYADLDEIGSGAGALASR